MLCCIHDFRGRGAEHVLSILLNKIDQSKFETGVFVYRNIYSYSLPDTIPVFSLNEKNKYKSTITKLLRFLQRLTKFIQIIKSFKPLILLSIAGTNELAILGKILCGSKLKVVISEHAVLSRLEVNNWNSPLGRIKRRMISFLYPFADMIIGPSTVVISDLISFFNIPANKTKVVGNPLEIDVIKEKSLAAPDFIKPDNEFIVGYIGSLSLEKNVQCLIRAIGILATKQKSIKLDLIGDGPERTHLIDLSKKLKIDSIVRFRGFQENPYTYLRIFDVLVITSLHETLSYVILEAMTLGIPVITSNWKGVNDIYADEKNCLIFPMNDHSALANAVERIQQDKLLKRKLIDNGLELIKKYEAQNVVGEYENLLSGVMQNQEEHEIVNK